MAYRPRRTSRRRSGSYGRSAGGRASYRRAPVRRASRRRSTGGARTIRIEVVNSAAPAARPVIGMKPAAAPYKRMF